MTDPQINCPNCSHEIRLTESLAAPLIEATRKRFQEQLATKDAEVAREKAALRLKQDELAKAKENFEEQIVARLNIERTTIAASEQKKAREAAAIELEGKTRQVSELQQLLDQNNAKLAEAQKAEAELRKKQRELDEKIREADLTVEKRIQQGLVGVQAKAKQDAEETFHLTIADKDKQLSDMGKTVEEQSGSLNKGLSRHRARCWS